MGGFSADDERVLLELCREICECGERKEIRVQFQGGVMQTVRVFSIARPVYVRCEVERRANVDIKPKIVVG